MDATQRKSERLDLRLTPAQKATIEEAATIEGSTAAGFTIAAVMERASEAVYRARTLTLPGAGWLEFMTAVDAAEGLPEATRAFLRETEE